MENTAFDLVFWSNVVAGSSLMGYAYFLWAQARGWINPSARLVFGIRLFCLFAFMLPVVVRYHYTEHLILLLSVVIVLIGVIIRLRNKLGI